MRRGQTLCAIIAALCTLPLPLLLLHSAQAEPVTGNATYFDALGSPYGGCGLPQAELDSPHFVALNALDTPGDYNSYTRPLPASQADKIGAFDNGRNCGRFVKVTLSDFCTGVNDGAPGQPFCRNGSWVADAYNGGTLTMLVADSCADGNAWCRDDPYHLDLARASLNQFVKDGRTLTDLHPGHWNNRRVSWEYIPAPNYTGDIRIGFMRGAQRWWPAIAISRLPNGIHGVDYFADGAWRAAAMNGDMGQSYIIGGTTSGATEFRIRVRDAADQLVNNGRVYNFTLPSACASQCSAAYTNVPYTTGAGTPEPSGSTTPPPATCLSARWRVDSSWSNGSQVTVTVTNCGTVSLSGWRVTWTFPGSQTIASSWNATLAQSGARVTAGSTSNNAAIPPGGSASFGFIVNGPNQAPTDLAASPA
jgi:expansin (peptidoglycan-binding protein)